MAEWVVSDYLPTETIINHRQIFWKLLFEKPPTIRMHWRLIEWNQAENGRNLTLKKKRISLVEVQNYMYFPLRTIPNFCVTEWLKFKQEITLFLLEVSEESLELPEQLKIREGSVAKRELWRVPLKSLAESELYMHEGTPWIWKKAIAKRLKILSRDFSCWPLQGIQSLECQCCLVKRVNISW